MRPDLLQAQASVDWAIGQLPDLSKRLDEWLKRGVTIEVKVLPPPADNLIVAVENELLPLAFHAEVGAYLNSIRSSLDVLAMTLVKRHNIAIPEHQVYFPITKTEEEFEKKGRQLLAGLSALDQRLMREQVKPYLGGNDLLWMLHHLDIVRKHRRLLNTQLKPIHMWMAGTLAEGDFTPLGGEGSIQVGEETVLGMIRKGVPTPAIHTRFYIAIEEPGIVRRPVEAVLAQMASAATFAIKLFDA
ncbi:hypothetical protein JQ616_37950 [Bradyrhizobium tropiciagri]|uniref:hypothetical protein n=1 Tax=Bradyrhizobium TaxID=374 RepID=UPI001A1C99D7|nr:MULTISPECIES: hypothetical protein [Bradyrhizobium]MBJ7402098.1 hypothetical protein [Bradyrhizobium sp.]MBR0900771.1 hypothetical protein [Bradyrhizobium tropiciagri]